MRSGSSAEAQQTTCTHLRSVAEATRRAPGEERGTHPSSAFIELAGGRKAKDLNASNTGKI